MAPRRLILCADDYGLAPGVNTAIRDLIARGRLNATSAMVVSPSFDREAAAALIDVVRSRPHVAVGLHLTLTAPFKPLTGFEPLARGAFPPLAAVLARAMTLRLDLAALEKEADAQLTAFTEMFGQPPDFIDGHHHVHVFPRVREAVFIARERRAPNAWMRQCGRVRRAGGDPKGWLLDLLSYGFRKRATALGITVNPAFAGTYVFEPSADFARLFPGFLADLPDGGLVMCHPGTVDAELERLDPVTTLRENEYAYLGGEAFPRALKAAGFRLF